jgi:hypothetical protein
MTYPPEIPSYLLQRYRKHCPFEGCEWEHDFTSLDPLAYVDGVCEAHLNEMHTGWTLAGLHKMNDERLAFEVEATTRPEEVADETEEWLHGQDLE